MIQTPLPSNKPPLTSARPPKFNFWTSLGTTLSVAILVATLFTVWTPAGLFSNQLADSLARAVSSQAAPNRNLPTKTPFLTPHIGLVSGHWGEEKPGFICPDGTRESDVNLAITTLVRQGLVEQGYTVDLFKEFDPALRQYTGLMLLSIHTDTCTYIDDTATGFKLASSYYTDGTNSKIERLSACIIDRYSSETGLKYINIVTDDMTKFHTFEEVHVDTPTLIMEPGYLNLDRELLTKSPEKVAKAITDGLLCYLKNQPMLPTPTPSLLP
jgi:N-acetylmuramoyl-L-alanine amidase